MGTHQRDPIERDRARALLPWAGTSVSDPGNRPPLGVPESPKTRRNTYIVVAIVFALLIVMFVSCAVRGVSTSSSSSSTTKYDQTWPKSYSNTTCTEWNSDMTSQQQFAAAADMLTGARNKGDGGTGLPADAMISDFQLGLTTVCVVPSLSLAEVGAGLYLSERDRFRP